MFPLLLAAAGGGDGQPRQPRQVTLTAGPPGGHTAKGVGKILRLSLMGGLVSKDPKKYPMNWPSMNIFEDKCPNYMRRNHV